MPTPEPADVEVKEATQQQKLDMKHSYMGEVS